MNSSSFNFINGDRRLLLPERILYRIINGLANQMPPKKTPHLLLKLFRLEHDTFHSSILKLSRTSSPSRMLSDLFWMNLPWAEIERALGEINMVDAGCGSGGVFSRLREMSEDRIRGYCGFDVKNHPNWEILSNDKFKFVTSTAERFSENIPEG